MSHNFPDDDGIFLKIKKTTSLVGKCSVIVELMLYREKINSTINMCCKPNKWVHQTTLQRKIDI